MFARDILAKRVNNAAAVEIHPHAFGMLSMHELRLSMPGPMLSPSMLTLATFPDRAQRRSEHCSEYDFVQIVWNVRNAPTTFAWSVPNTSGTFSMHELSLSMPEPLLSLSMLIESHFERSEQWQTYC